MSADLISVKSLHDKCNCFRCRDKRELNGAYFSALGWKVFDGWCKKYIEKHPEAEDLNALEMVEIYNSDKDDIPKNEVKDHKDAIEFYKQDLCKDAAHSEEFPEKIGKINERD